MSKNDADKSLICVWNEGMKFTQVFAEIVPSHNDSADQKKKYKASLFYLKICVERKVYVSEASCLDNSKPHVQPDKNIPTLVMTGNC